MARTAIMILLTAAGLVAADGVSTYTGQIVDSATKKPIAGATVTVGITTARTGADGVFRIEGTLTETILVRAWGYRRAQVSTSAHTPGMRKIELAPCRPKALYLSVFGIGSQALREPAVRLIEATELNALVIDVKGDRGLIPYRTSVPLAAQADANRIITVKDIQKLVADLHTHGLYLIARIVVFKDDPLASARPDFAVKSSGNRIWRDREGLRWTDPGKKEARDYNIDIAVEAARNGFDEIQFDYARFPDAIGLTFCVPNDEENRVRAISQFFEEARKRLVPYNVFLAADIFGYVCWNLNDTCIGQKLEALAPLVDYISPMLYPSGFRFGIPGYRLPVAHSSEIVRLSLDKARQRTGLTPLRFRPWLQAFRDYAFDHRVFGAMEIRDQIQAAEDFGSDGWMLWNPHNRYSAAGLHPGQAERPETHR